MRIALSILFAVLLCLRGVAAQEIVVGPYRFGDETWFAASAFFHPNPRHTTPTDDALHWTPPSVGAGAWMLVGFSPDTGLVNLGNGPAPCPHDHGRELLDFGFDDVSAVNGPGPDIVVFDARFSADDYEIAVGPRGEPLTAFRFHRIVDQRPTGHAGPSGSSLWGVEIDLTAYGVAPGVHVDRIQIAGDGTRVMDPTRCAEADPVMAAVLHPPCPCDDGDECTWDCGAHGECASVPHDVGTPCSVGVCDGAASPRCVECIEDGNCRGDRPRCDVTARLCVECLAPADCDDGRDCTNDICTTGICGHVPMASGAPCVGGICDGEAEPACVECLADAHCDDAVECTIDRCVEGDCASVSAPRGVECASGICDGDPDEPRCAPCASDVDCGDEFNPFCGAEGLCVSCREDGDCHGEGECVGGAICTAGGCVDIPLAAGTPCTSGTCDGDAVAPTCVCRLAEHCDDGDACTRDVCRTTSGVCEHLSTCVDAGLGDDAGPDEDARPRGCSCRVAPRRTASEALSIGGAALLAAAWRRMSARRSKRARADRERPPSPGRRAEAHLVGRERGAGCRAHRADPQGPSNGS